MSEIQKTHRGFKYTKFIDHYGYQCSIQKSSLATEDCIWLGCDNPKVKILVQNLGWQDIQLPEDADIFGCRMHLTQDMIKELIPILQHFVQTGNLP